MSWGIHHCASDPECQQDVPPIPNRLYLRTPIGFLVIALDRNSWTQAWLPFKGYTKQWLPVVWIPR